MKHLGRILRRAHLVLLLVVNGDVVGGHAWDLQATMSKLSFGALFAHMERMRRAA